MGPMHQLMIFLFLVLPNGLVLYSLVAGRPSARRVRRFVGRQGLHLDDPGREALMRGLRRTYRGRVAGALAGFAVGVVVVAYRREPGWAVLLLTVIVGGVVGTVAAQLGAGDRASAIRSASLRARTPDAYLHENATTAEGATLALLVGYAVLVGLTAQDRRIAVALTGAALAGGGVAAALISRRIMVLVLERARPDDATLTRVDDALRAVAVRTVHHALLAVLLSALAILGFTGTMSQTFEGVMVSGDVVFRTPSGGKLLTAEPVPQERPHRTVVIRWRDAHGEERVAEQPMPADGVVDYGRLMRGNIVLMGVGFWVVILGYLGAVVAWIRSGAFWRTRSVPRPSPEVPRPVPRPA